MRFRTHRTIAPSLSTIALLLAACTHGLDDPTVGDRNDALTPCDPTDSSCADDSDPNGEVGESDVCAAVEGCPPPLDTCTELATELEALLLEARSCTVSSVPAIEPCSQLLPSIDLAVGCLPANAQSDATAKYLQLYEEYVDICAGGVVTSCTESADAAMGCVQDPDIDGLEGVCDFLGAAQDDGEVGS